MDPTTTCPVPEIPGGRLLTTSRLSCRRRCAREHRLSYELAYRPVMREEPLRLGSLVHAGLEAWWRYGHGDEDWLAALDAAARQSAEPDPYLLARAEVMLRAYDARWCEDRARYHVLAVEAAFECALPNPATGAESRTWRLAGKVDAIVREIETGRVLLVEHKTTTEDVTPGSDYWKRLRMDAQISHYFLGAQALGYDVAGCMYDVLVKPGQRPSSVAVVDEDGVKVVRDATGARVKTKDGKKWRESGDAAQGYVLETRPETPDEFRARLADAYAREPERYFARGEVVRLDGEIADHLTDVWQLGRAIREDQLAGRFPRNPDSCVRYGRTCSFFPVCSGEASIDDRSLYRVAETAHEELSTETAGG